jgi:hypothetical protein
MPPPPPGRSIGIIRLPGKLRKVPWGQYFAGKILILNGYDLPPLNFFCGSLPKILFSKNLREAGLAAPSQNLEPLRLIRKILRNKDLDLRLGIALSPFGWIHDPSFWLWKARSDVTKGLWKLSGGLGETFELRSKDSGWRLSPHQSLITFS